ncbi:MAG: BTAD domain-containing putative transcriptional regulator [Longimicrobiales bacterium]|nr:BTAD domain-containing putative transcriptional regulator [Longimicrobiales bacterium]
MHPRVGLGKGLFLPPPFAEIGRAAIRKAIESPKAVILNIVPLIVANAYIGTSRSWFFSPNPGLSSTVPFLRLLGGAYLEEAGEVLSGKAAQKRRLVLLALLATATGRSMSRERLIALVWPRKRESQGRRLLSVAVYDIRKELGDEVLVSRGDDLVLNAEALPSDVAELEAAIAAGDMEQAVRLYGGRFLDDFVVRGSAELEQRIDAIREHYASLYRKALEQVARQRDAAGDSMGAVELWKKLAAADPYNSRVAMGLVRALNAAGNRAGALKAARVHELLLREEFDVEPDPELTALVEDLREGRTIEEDSQPSPLDPSPIPTAEAGPIEPEEQVDESRPSSFAPATAASATKPAPRRTGGSWAQTWLRRVLRSRRWRHALLIAAAVGLLAGMVGRDLWGWLETAAVDGDGYLAVAVLPLHPVDTADAAWADGITDQLIETLANTAGIQVSTRSAAFAMRGVPPAEALRRLDVDFVLTGVARRGPERASVVLELSGPEGHVEWADSYARPTDQVIRIDTWEAIASEVRAQLAAQLAAPGQLPEGSRTGDAVPPELGGWTDDPLAHERYLKGRREWFSRAPDGFVRAQRYFASALQRDPEFARALIGIADVYNLMGSYDYGLMHPDSAYPRARRAVERALGIAPRLHEGWAALAQVLYVYDRDWEAADSAYREAIRLYPRNAQTHHRYSLYLVAMGRRSEAMAEAQRALELDSLSAVMNAAVARHHYFQRKYDRALEAWTKAHDLDPGYFHAYLGRGLSFMALERPQEAAAAFRQGLELAGGAHPLSMALLHCALAETGDAMAPARALETLAGLRNQGRYVPHEYDAILHIAHGAMNEAMDALEAAFEDNSSGAVFLNVHPLVDPLRGNPRFQALVERVGLPSTRDG